MRMKKKIALVTGGGSGIGRASALRLAEEGAGVAVADIDEGKAQETAQEIGKLPNGQAIAVQFDALKEDHVAEVFNETLTRFGRLDALLCSAGIAVRQKAADADFDSWNRVNEVNLRGLWLCAKYALRTMVDQGSGSIIFVSSSSGRVGVPDRAAYCASKAGVIGLMRSIVFDYAKFNVRCNCLCPGVTRTPINADYLKSLEESDPDGWSAPMYHPPMVRLGTPSDMANAVLYLAGDESSYVNGIELPVDGGATCL